jgi:D-glycero-D-manno-heptose 1,7-bisphosphate phosphatase
MLYLFDLDGTLISGYMDNPDRNFHQWQILPGRRETIAGLLAAGHQVAVISNQAGVGYGFVSKIDVYEKLSIVGHDFGFGTFAVHAGSTAYASGCGGSGGQLTCFICFEKDSPRRKPGGAMITEAMQAFNNNDALMVGDRPEDEAAAKNAGLSFQWANVFFGD